MKILLTMNIPYFPARGGADKGSRRLAEELAGRGHQVEVVVPALGTPARLTRGEVRDRLAELGVTVAEEAGADRYRLRGVGVYALPDASSLRGFLMERIRSGQPDRVLVASEDPSHNLLAAALAIDASRVVYLVHTPAFLPFGPHAFFPSAARAELLRQVAAVVAVSEFAAGYVRVFGGLPATAFHLPAYGPGPFRQLGRCDRGFVTLVNPCALKGLPIFLGLARALPRVRFAAVPTWGTTRADRAALAALPNVTLLAPEEDFERILGRTRVLLMPSLVMEGFGIAAVEAMLRGVPVLASDLGGLAEAKLGTDYRIAVRPIERFGDQLDENLIPVAVLPEQDVEPWREALSELLGDRELYERQAAAGREAALRFTAGLSVAPLERLLESLGPPAAAARPAPAAARAAAGVVGTRPAPAAGGSRRPEQGPTGRQEALADLGPERLAILVLRLRRQREAAAAAAEPPIRRAPRAGRLPLSFAQQRLWFVDQLRPGIAAYNIPAAVAVDGPLDAAAFAAALREVVRRHEALRTVFAAPAGRPHQIVQPCPGALLCRVDLAALPEARRQGEAGRLADQEGSRPFDLARGPLLRALLFRLGRERHVFVLALHHIVADGWSLRIVFEEIAALYEGFAAGVPRILPAPPLQYADFAVWQREWQSGARLAAELAWWRRQLGAAPPPRLPTFHSRGADSGPAAAEPFTVPAPLVERLLAFGRNERATLFITLLTALGVLLQRTCGEDEVAVGAYVANRHRQELESVVGCFVNILVLRADLSGSPSFRQALRRVRRVVLDAQAHQDLPFEKLVEVLAPGDRGRSALFQVAFAFEDPASAPPPEIRGLRLDPLPLRGGAAKFELSLVVNSRPPGLACRFEYDPALFAAASVRRMGENLRELLVAAAERPDEEIEALGLAPAPLDPTAARFSDDLESG
jgi:glycosyltransferase involved in cell wall biosynthesis